MDKNKYLGGQRQRRQYRVRKRTRGAVGRPRLTVYRSHRNLACQIVDDVTGKTLVSAGTQEQELRSGIRYGGNKAAAEAIGKKIAERALAAGIKEVCFDRGHYLYHGRVAALATAARGAGLSF